MKNRLKIHAVWGFAVAALLLAQLGCSSKTTENAATAQPSPSPSATTDLTAASPTPDATSSAASNPGSVASNAAANSSAAPARSAGAGAAPAAPSAAPPRFHHSRGRPHFDIHGQGSFHQDRQGRRSLYGQSGAPHRRRRLGDRQERRVGPGRCRQHEARACASSRARAIAGGGKGAAIGAGAGGGAGTGLVLATRGDPAVVPSESKLTFRLQGPITVTKR